MIMEPGIDGLDTYKKILEIHPGQKSIIASGYSESARVKEAQLLGAGTYVKKPYLLEKIGRAVRTELEQIEGRLLVSGDWLQQILSILYSESGKRKVNS